MGVLNNQTRGTELQNKPAQDAGVLFVVQSAESVLCPLHAFWTSGHCHISDSGNGGELLSVRCQVSGVKCQCRFCAVHVLSASALSSTPFVNNTNALTPNVYRYHRYRTGGPRRPPSIVCLILAIYKQYSMSMPLEFEFIN